MRSLLLIALLICVDVAFADATFHGDVQRTGNFTFVYGNDLLWQTQLTSNFIEGSPIAKDGFVYVLTVPSMSPETNELGLYKLYAKNGTVKDSLTGVFFGRTAPTVYEDLIFVHATNASNTDQSWLYCIYAENLSIKWSRPINNGVAWWYVDSHPLVYNKTVYVLAYKTGTLYAFDLNGNERIMWAGGGSVSPYTSPSAYNGFILFAANESGKHELVKMDENGNVKWTYPVDGPIVSGIAIDYGYAFFTTMNVTTGICRLYAVNLTEPSDSWNVILPGKSGSGGGVWRLTPAVGNGHVIVGTRGDAGWTLDNNDSVLCYDLNGNLKWQFNSTKGLNGDVGGSPIIAGKYVFFTTNTEHGTLYALYLSNGSVAWKYDLEQWCLSSPFVWNGKLFVGADNGNLYCFGNFSTIWDGTVTLSTENVSIKLSDNSQKEIYGASALYALIKAGELGNFEVNVTKSPYGLYVYSVAGINAKDNCGWMYWVNYPKEPVPSVAAEKYSLEDYDVVLWYYGCWDPDTWETTKPPESEYVVKILSKIQKPIEITKLTASPSQRGGNVTAYVNVTSYSSNWYVIVVSGVNENGEPIAGIATFYLEKGQHLDVPVLIHVPQKNEAGKYKLFAGVYKYSEYPEGIIHVSQPTIVEVR